jgi:hypothetical protein
MKTPPRINRDRLLERLATFNQIDALPAAAIVASPCAFFGP